MKFYKIRLAFSFLALALVWGCADKNNSANNNNSEVPDMHTSEIALDWLGTYSGILPCADCPGIATDLVLKPDNSYLLISEYLDTQTPLIDTVSGHFEWEGNNIALPRSNALKNARYFKVEENRVRYLDLEGQVITGALEEFYILTKQGNPKVEDKKWVLKQLNGQEINGHPETHFIIFHSKDGKAEIKANCNLISMNYTIKNGLLLKMGEGTSTLMACPDDSLEKEFLDVLSHIDNLSINGDTLTLNKARMSPMAVFELVN